MPRFQDRLAAVCTGREKCSAANHPRARFRCRDGEYYTYERSIRVLSVRLKAGLVAASCRKTRSNVMFGGTGRVRKIPVRPIASRRPNTRTRSLTMSCLIPRIWATSASRPMIDHSRLDKRKLLCATFLSQPLLKVCFCRAPAVGVELLFKGSKRN